MSQWPKSLTAVVHVKLSYDENHDEEETRPAGEDEVAPLDQLRNHVSKLDPYLRELVIRFAEEIRDESFSEKGGDGQSPE
jgi:hypothetical protein